MPNEFIIKNGFRSQGNSNITGSISISGSLVARTTTDGSNVTLIGNNNHTRIFSISNTDSTNTTFGFGFATYSDGGSNRYIELFGDNTTGNYLQGNWASGGSFTPVGGLIGSYHSNLNIIQKFSNTINTGIVFSNENNSYRTVIWREGQVSIADSSYVSGSQSTSRLFVKGTGTTSATTALLVQNANASASLTVKDDGSSTMLSSNELPFTVSHTNGSSTLGFVLGNGSQMAAGFAALRLNGSTNVFTFNTSRITTSLPLTVNGPTDTFYIRGGGGGTDVVSPSVALTDNTYNAGGYTVTSGTQTTVQIGGIGAPSNSVWKPASGTANYTLLAIAPNMSGSGTYSGTIRGIYYNPTVTSTIYSAHRAIETTSGDVIFNGGNVGIGTSTPSRTLEVYKSGLVDGSIEGLRITTQHSSATAQTALEFYHTYGSSGLSRIATDIGNGGTNPSMYFVVNGTTIMKLANTGNVQIGTTTDAGYKLDVNGNARVQSTLNIQRTPADFLVKFINQSNTTTIGAISHDVSGGITVMGGSTFYANSIIVGINDMISFSTAGTGEKMRISSTGNVGIGTSTPTSRLSVSGSAGTGSAIYAYKSGSTVLDIQGSQGQLFSVVDALSGSLMSVNDVSGLPILEVFSDDRVVMGTYGAPALIVTGSNTVISGSLRGRVVTLSTASATASMDCSLSNFFDLTLSGSMYLGVSNIQPGETINLRITQPATSGSLNYTSSIKFPNGLPYSASATSSVVDLISFISFDSSTLYATSLKNLV